MKRLTKPVNKSAPWSTNRYLLLIALLLFVVVFLRLYRLAETIPFFDDQGLDMVSIFHIEQTGKLPLVGPFLSIPNIYTPPTYYYITHFFYDTFSSVINITYGYAMMNIISIIVLASAAYAMMGHKGAVIMMVLAGFSRIMIDHSRYFWQPYPVQLFLALWLLFSWRAITTRRIFFLLMASVWYQLALSVYPSPIIMFPLVISLIFSWYRNMGVKSWIRISLLSGFTVILPFSLVFSPQILFEATNGFPTLQGILQSPTAPTTFHPVSGIFSNAALFLTSFFATDPLMQLPELIVTTMLCGILIYLTLLLRSRTQPTSPVLAPSWVFPSAFALFALVPLEANLHRSLALLPLALLWLTHLLTRTFTLRSGGRLLSLLVLGTYVILNVNAVKWYWNGQAANGIEQTKRVAHFILQDLQTRNIPHDSVEFFYKIPNDPNNGSYGVYRILFWLMHDGGVSYPLTDAYFMPHNYSHLRHTPYLYLICRGFTSSEALQRDCVALATRPYRYRQISVATFETMTVFVLEYENGTTEFLHDSELSR